MAQEALRVRVMEGRVREAEKKDISSVRGVLVDGSCSRREGGRGNYLQE